MRKVIVSINLFALVCMGYSGAGSAYASVPDKEDRARNYFTDEIVFDQEGKSYRFYSDLLKGKIVLINFLYTGCKDACPLITKHLQALRKTLTEDEKKRLLFISFSVDPAKDDAVALREFIKKQNIDTAGWVFVSAKLDVSKRILGKLGQWTDNPENHGTILLLGNVPAAHWKKLHANHSVTKLGEDIRTVLIKQ